MVICAVAFLTSKPSIALVVFGDCVSQILPPCPMPQIHLPDMLWQMKPRGFAPPDPVVWGCLSQWS